MLGGSADVLHNRREGQGGDAVSESPGVHEKSPQLNHSIGQDNDQTRPIHRRALVLLGRDVDASFLLGSEPARDRGRAKQNG